MTKNNIPYPLYESIDGKDINTLIKIFASKKDFMLLESAKPMETYGEYSWLCFDAFGSFMSKGEDHYWNSKKILLENPFDFLNAKIREYRLQKNRELPDFQGGALGYFGYEASHYLETLPTMPDNSGLPDIYLNFYSNLIAINHKTNQAFIIASGFPEKADEKRILLAKRQISCIKKAIQESKTKSPRITKKIVQTVSSNFSQTSYARAVVKTREYILQGDIFEANISQQFTAALPEGLSLPDLYFKLKRNNPAPFSACLKLPSDAWLISASPERFLRLREGQVETAPIKGTRKRSRDPGEDQYLQEELLSSEKDRAENIMIVDLMRNDLSRVCKPGSVKVSELCVLKSFETVHHLVSTIKGTLREGKNAIDLLKAAFPPGSITGAPKIRAMEIISELEGQARGPYCGSIVWLGFAGDMDSSVVIRTYCVNGNQIYFNAGGAVVLDSDPDAEYLESLAKARALIETLTQ